MATISTRQLPYHRFLLVEFLQMSTEGSIELLPISQTHELAATVGHVADHEIERLVFGSDHTALGVMLGYADAELHIERRHFGQQTHAGVTS